MPGKSRRPKAEWAAEVAIVPFRSLSLRQLGPINERQGWGFSSTELSRIQSFYRGKRRDPTDVELAGLAQSWSEHCSYKTSRPFLKAAFGRLPSESRVLGRGDAGVMKFVGPWAYALRIESHNHPSAIEPYGGAATGIGGILRDVLAVGAKPIALADPIFFGPLNLGPDDLPTGVKSPRYLMAGVVSGISDYGNRVGVPTVSGGVYFDPAYTVNPLVNVACLGILPRTRLRPNRAERAGNHLVLAGGLTGRDGIGGVAFASKEITRRSEDESRGAVQLGNPITKEPLIRACLEAFDRGLVRGIKDLGGGGLSTGVGELAFAGGLGLEVHLDRVPLREEHLQPWEIWISEPQEEMVLDVRPKDVATLLALFQRFDVPATAIGTFLSAPEERIFFHGKLAGNLPLKFRLTAPDGYSKISRPAKTSSEPALLSPAESATGIVESLVLAPDSLSRESVIRVYDHEVQGHTVVKPLHGRVVRPSHGDAAVLQPVPDLWSGLATTVAAQPWSCLLDPYVGSIWTAEEAARNLYAVGARPDAFTDCLNFGNPSDPAVLGSFAESVRGIAHAARGLAVAVPSGNVSFYNGGLGGGIPPTPVLFAVGIVLDVRSCVTSDFKAEGNPIYLVGRSAPELGGSLWARLRRHQGLGLPAMDPSMVRKLGEKLLRAMKLGLIVSAHDVPDGGLAVSLCEMAFGGGLGFDVDLLATGLPTPSLALAAEGRSRWVVEVPESFRGRFERGFLPGEISKIGVTVDGPARFSFGSQVVSEILLEPLRERWLAGLGVP